MLAAVGLVVTKMWSTQENPGKWEESRQEGGSPEEEVHWRITPVVSRLELITGSVTANPNGQDVPVTSPGQGQGERPCRLRLAEPRKMGVSNHYH